MQAIPYCRTMVLSVITFCLIGCGDGRVTGKVTYQEKIVTRGTVQFLGPDGILKSAILSADGTFTFDALTPGSYKVAVSSPDPVQEAKDIAAQQRTKPGEAPIKPNEIDRTGWFPIPTKVNSPEQSGLTVQVKSGKNDVTVVIP